MASLPSADTGPASDGPPDGLGPAVVGHATDLVRTWLSAAAGGVEATERRQGEQLRRLTGDARSVAFAMAFCDRVLRPESAPVAAGQLRRLVRGPLPPFLSSLDRLLLRAGAVLSGPAPGVVMPLARRRLRHLVGGLVADRSDRPLRRHLAGLQAGGYRVNVNLLGEFVLGDGEAGRRRSATLELLERDDVSYISVKASSVTAQLNLWAYDDTRRRVERDLRPLLLAAARADPPKFVNLDMEEYDDLRLTVDAFTTLLSEPELAHLEAGIVLQAYLPDSFDVLRQLVDWAGRRRAAGGAGIKIRIVKGANLAMERVDAAMHGWVQAPFATKADTDANYKRMVDWVLTPQRLGAVRIGVASHNLFDVAWSWLLAQGRQVTTGVDFEMLQGMAPAVARAVRDATGGLLLYTPVVAEADFDSALAYLFRRLEENSSGDNFIRHLFDLAYDDSRFDVERRRFEEAVARRWDVDVTPRRHRPHQHRPVGFDNRPDGDPSDPLTRDQVLDALARPSSLHPEPTTDGAAVDRAVTAARAALGTWAGRSPAERRALLRRAGDELDGRRADLVAVMADEAGKTISEADREVSEAADFAHLYAERIPDAGGGDGAAFTPLGVMAVIPPWNFPVAIPAGGVLAALAAGNTVVLKPAPQTPRCALEVSRALWAAGIPEGALQYLNVPDDTVAQHLVSHPGVDGIILTGAYETAAHIASVAPDTPLFAETSGKNTLVILPDADIDLAVADLVASAFGHAGQKCSAASLAICVGDLATSKRFRRQLVDATTSLRVGFTERPEVVMGPLIGAPSPALRRALTALDPGQRWLVEPRPVDAGRHLWSPGIIDGVAPGSWFHRTECFGPVLGLMAARDLDQAVAIQNAVPYGLTGGIHTLDPVNADRWLGRVEVGNAYVNRGITGAVVNRQPFGGWKHSVVGPGAKAGGPNYVAQLGHWHPAGTPRRGRRPSPAVGRLVDRLAADLGPADAAALVAAARSDAHWWAEEFSVDHDPSGLFCEANVFRYRPLPSLPLRVTAGARPADVARVLIAMATTGAAPEVSIHPDYPGPTASIAHRREHPDSFRARLARDRPERVRRVGPGPDGDGPQPVSIYVDTRVPVPDGRVELGRYLREQAVSRTRHRFGNLVDA